MKKMLLLTILFLSFNVSLFAQIAIKKSNDPKPATEREKSNQKIKLIDWTTVFDSIGSLLTAEATSSLRKQLGDAEFEKLKVYGNETNYPDCLTDKMDDAIMLISDYDGLAALFNKFTMYKVASFYSTVKSVDLTVVKISASENKTIDNCAIPSDLYFIVLSSGIKKV